MQTKISFNRMFFTILSIIFFTLGIYILWYYVIFEIIKSNGFFSILSFTWELWIFSLFSLWFFILSWFFWKKIEGIYLYGYIKIISFIVVIILSIWLGIYFMIGFFYMLYDLFIANSKNQETISRWLIYLFLWWPIIWSNTFLRFWISWFLLKKLHKKTNSTLFINN